MTELRQRLNGCLEGAFTNQEPASVPGAQALDGLKSAVCGLGDSDHLDSWSTGKRFDTRLEELGATRMISRADCDVDFEETAGAWGSELLADLGGTSATPSAVSNSPAAKTESFSKKNPSRVQLLDDVQLNGDGSERDTRHSKISLEGLFSGVRLRGLAFSEAELLRDGAG